MLVSAFMKEYEITKQLFTSSVSYIHIRICLYMSAALFARVRRIFTAKMPFSRNFCNLNQKQRNKLQHQMTNETSSCFTANSRLRGLPNC